VARSKNLGNSSRPNDATARARARAASPVRVQPIEFDRLIHEHIRLGIVSALAANATLSFNALKVLLKTTDGNLSIHARKLEEAGYITCRKYFSGRVPKTEFGLTPAGRRAFEGYLNEMETLIRSSRSHA
jgi:DNA-binding HxlR family transcriptional regulator